MDVRCNLCGADDAKVRYPSTLEEREPGAAEGWSAYACTSTGYGRHQTIVQCQRCGLVYTNPRNDDQTILDTYEAVEDDLYIEEREGRVLTFEHHLKPLERLTGRPNHRRLLDVGCHIGVFLDIAEQHGWDAWGIEPSQWAVVQARAQNLHVIEGTLASAGLPAASFDVITMWDVIEHLTDPKTTLQHAHRLLKPSGLLVVHTIDIESGLARLMGPRWPWLMEMHLTYFSRRTLRMMLEMCGFRVIRARPQGRFLRLGYLMNRVQALTPRIGGSAEWLVTQLGLRGIAVPINLGDLFTAYARKAPNLEEE